MKTKFDKSLCFIILKEFAKNVSVRRTVSPENPPKRPFWGQNVYIL